ncbi:hypothetical protein VKT23_015603 [Stygiomarasmius scandens]|uniref:Uncharacterized protein n=1 Tax=Marasmiellus scandens TaxID=2682957 RepID=A0ABR1IXH6_9AGAR
MDTQDQAAPHDEDHSMSPPAHSHTTPQDDAIMDPSDPAHEDGTSEDTRRSHSSTLASRPFTFTAPAENMDIDRQTIPSETITKPSVRRRIVRSDVSNMQLLQNTGKAEKRKRADGEEEESQKVFVMDPSSNEEFVYQLKMDISDLERANKSLRDEVMAFKVLDPSLVDDVDISVATPRERKLVAVINSLKNQTEQLLLASDSGLADLEPTTDNERKLLTRINQLEALNNADKMQKEAFMMSLKNAEKARDAASQQSTALQETNTEIQAQLRNLQTARYSQPPNEEIAALKVQITCLLDDKTALQQRIASYQQAGRQASAADAALGDHLQVLFLGLQEALSKVFNSNNETAERPQNDASDGQIAGNEESSQASLPSLGAGMVTQVQRLINEINKLCHDKDSLVDSLSQARNDNSMLSAERNHLARQEEVLQNLSSEKTTEIERLTELIHDQNSTEKELTKVQTENSNLLRRLKEMEETHEVERMFEPAQNDRTIEIEDLKADLGAMQRNYDSEKQKSASLQQARDEASALLKAKVEEYNQEKERFGMELSLMQEQKENLCREKSKLTQDLEDLTTSCEQNQKALILKQNQAAELDDNIKTLKSTNQELRDHLKLAEDKRDELSQKERVLQENVDKAQKQKGTLEAELREAAEIHQQQMEELKAIYNQAKLEIEGKLKASNERLGELQKSNQTEVQKLKGDANSAKSQVELLQHEINTLKAEKQNLENAKVQIEAEKLSLETRSQESNEIHQQLGKSAAALHGKIRGLLIILGL